MQGLEGLRVLELGDRVSAAYAAKVLADIGADVVKLEEPGGDRTRRRRPNRERGMKRWHKSRRE